MPGIVITGTGLAVNLGLSPAEVWEAIAAGQSALRPMPALEQRPATDKGGGQAADLPTSFRQDLPRAARYLRYVIEQAVRAAGVEAGSRRVAIVMGTTLHGMRAGGEALRSGDLSLLRGFLAGSVMEAALADIAVAGPVLTTCSACSSGLGSVAIAATLLTTGQADAVIAGGYDSVSEYSYAGFDSLGLVATGAPRPFAKDRDGMKVAEGYAALVLERAADARSRSAPVLAPLAGFGETSDSFHLTQPQPEGEGAARAIRGALSDAGVGADVIDLIIAHATATPNNDAAEHAALRAVLGERLASVPLAALKSHLGHTLGGAGAVELVLAIEALRRQQAPPTAGTYEPEFAGLRVIRGAALDHAIRGTLNLSLGFGGANTCVVLGPRHREKPVTPPAVPAITGVGLLLPGAISLSELSALVDRAAPVDRDTGPIPEESYQHLLNARRTRRMSEYSKLTVAAATAACRDAGLEPGSSVLSRASAILGTTQGSTNFCEEYYGQLVREGLAAANPALFAEGVPNAAAAHLSMSLGLRGGCQTIIGSRRAGLDALALAALRIREGRWTCAIVSAAEEHSGLVARAYKACGLGRPVIGAGAVAFVLEDAEVARARGRSPLGLLQDIRWSRGTTLPDSGSPVAAHLGRLPRDRAVMEAFGERRVHNTACALPELFSAGPLAALALAMARHEPSFEVVSTGTWGGLTTVAVSGYSTPHSP